MKSKFTTISDLIFYSISTFAVAFAVLYYFCPYPYSLIISVSITLVAVVFFMKRFGKKAQEEKLKFKDKKNLEALVNELNFSTKLERLRIIERALNKAKLSHQRKNGGIYVESKRAFIYIKFGFEKVDKLDVIRAFNCLAENEKAYILDQSFDLEITSFANLFNDKIILVSADKLYKRLKDADSLPHLKYYKYLEKRKKGSLKLLLDKGKAKTFLLFGLFFLFMSYFSPIKLYHLLFGCAFVIYSLIVKMFGKDLKEKSYNY